MEHHKRGNVPSAAAYMTHFSDRHVTLAICKVTICTQTQEDTVLGTVSFQGSKQIEKSISVLIDHTTEDCIL